MDNSQHLSFEEAVKRFHEAINSTRVIPPQPNRKLSELRGRTWHLRNINGPLARVSKDGSTSIYSQTVQTESDEGALELVGGTGSCGDASNARKSQLDKQCDHEWVVFSTAIQDVCLMLQCVICGAHGSVDDPTAEEWSEAYHAPSHPYLWTANDRVNVQSVLPPDIWYVRKAPDMQAGKHRLSQEGLQ
jgi:hypothetical protein